MSGMTGMLHSSARHLVLAASALQALKSGTLSLYLSVPVPVLIPSVVTSRPTTASRLSSPLNPSVRKGGSTVLTVRVRYIIKAPLFLTGLSN